MFSSVADLARAAGSALTAGLGTRASDSGTLTTTRLIEAAGLSAEEHTVHTGDGYILTIHRIRSIGGPRPVVFLQHGWLCSSADWLLGPRNDALGFLLADAGYDVWLGNFRGNTYSRRHLTLDPELEEFWRFSFDENGQQDLPAMLDHVLAVTGRQKLVYIGHSMGTIAFWIMMNAQPEMNAKVELMVGLAPVAAAVLHPANPLVVGAMVVNKAVQLLNLTGQYELLAHNSLISGLKEKMFSTGRPGARATPRDLQDLVPTWSINRHAPSGTSSRTLLHWGQAVTTGRLTGFSYPTEAENMARHGAPTPPLYLLARVTCPALLYWGEGDWLTQPAGVAAIAAELPGLLGSVRVNHPAWNHFDFLWGHDAPVLVYRPLLQALGQHCAPAPVGRGWLTGLA